jgi:prevent-host-death family protein
MKTITATNARSNLFQFLKSVLKSHSPARISSKEGAVVVVPEEDYESLLETAELLAIPGLKESINEADKEIESGEVYSLKSVLED